jgi:hypothetical protein
MLVMIFKEIKKITPFECVLIVIGIFIGVLVYYGVESHSHHFPQVDISINRYFFEIEIVEILIKVPITPLKAYVAMFPSQKF